MRAFARARSQIRTYEETKRQHPKAKIHPPSGYWVGVVREVEFGLVESSAKPKRPNGEASG